MNSQYSKAKHNMMIYFITWENVTLNLEFIPVKTFLRISMRFPEKQNLKEVATNRHLKGGFFRQKGNYTA